MTAASRPGMSMPDRPPFLIVAYYYPPDIESGAARPHRFAKYLGKIGHEVKVISSFRGEIRPAVPDVFRVFAEGEGRERRGASGFVERCFRKAIFNHDPGVMWVPRVIRRASSLFAKGARPVVLSSAPPLTTHLAGLGLKL